jgi:chromosome segregation ATPase
MELVRLEENISELANNIAGAENAKRAQQQTIDAKDLEWKNAKDHRGQLEKQITDLQSNINQMTGAKASRLTLFDRNMPEAVRRIEAQMSRFREKPIGPLGMHVKILKEEWTPICEQLFGKNLNGFLVTTHEDQLTLRRILNETNWYCLSCIR